jgi:hypothetical protein
MFNSYQGGQILALYISFWDFISSIDLKFKTPKTLEEDNSQESINKLIQANSSSSLARMALVLGSRQLGNRHLGNKGSWQQASWQQRLLAAGTQQQTTWQNWHINQD